MTRSGGPSPAEQHLGDRLAALVDGELGHDARERVLAHLATCCKCKAEADAQRRLKRVFAQTAPPAPSEGFLARLQGLPGGSGDDGGGSPFGGSGVFGMRGMPGGAQDVREVPDPRERRERAFALLPPVAPGTAIAPAASAAASRERGFRIHEVERSAPRRRFAFAAAGAVSLAAFALGAALPLDAAVDPPGRMAEGPDTAVTPARADASTAGVRERTRREVGMRSAGDSRADVPSPAATPHPQALRQAAGAAALNPLIQPLLSATELLRTRSSTPPAPAPTLMEGPTQPATRTSPSLGVSASPD
ncbi:zf-HC2 domain-containing protein [Streptomyces sp. NA02950]|uniref:anti-sigma factor family protein n=1 Tax=Streptomyces sp. NA02950 TaxID=2742137 RepID=UPI001591BA1E|nr:zf-HC2 domain-containing protein [Streptomyces sp. NA02950]QKV92718.1 zf-HC2 domain-containing protein [Streptomyces sp. NA02950]